MKYFLTDDERIAQGGTCWFEFQSGRKRNKFKTMYWKNDSLYLDMNLMNETEWESFIPDFDYYGTTIITKGKWNYIQKHSGQSSPAFREMLSELTPWVEQVFLQFNYFYIIGM